MLEFDEEGNLIGHWGGPGEGYDWPDSNHGITVDYKGNVWIGGNGRGDVRRRGATPAARARCTPLPHAGRGPRRPALSRQHGPEVHAGRKIPDADRQTGQSKGSNDTENLGLPAKMFVDPKTNELYVADGYGNNRVIVFDADTGKYKRHWGAYGHKPDDTNLGRYNPDASAGPAVPQSGALRRAVERRPAVCLRPRERPHPGVQTGRDVREGSVHRQEHAGRRLGVGHRFLEGSAAEVHLSGRRRQREGPHHRLRDTLEVLTSFGDGGRQPGEFYAVHSIATDSKGNIFTTETYRGQRVQKFVYKGLAPVTKKDQGVVWPKGTKS